MMQKNITKKQGAQSKEAEAGGHLTTLKQGQCSTAEYALEFCTLESDGMDLLSLSPSARV